MTAKIVCVILNFICAILWTINAIKTKKVINFIAAICFYLLTGIYVFKIITLMN